MVDPNATDPGKKVLAELNAEGLTVLQKLAASKWGGVAIVVWTLAMVAVGWWVGR